MNSDLLWINEGFILDEAGNLITTSYIDLRAPGSRTAIRTLVKGCRREHALEDAETILVSPLERFRDANPGRATGLRRRRTGAARPPLLDSGLRITRRQTSHSVDRSSKRPRSGGYSRLSKPTRSGRHGERRWTRHTITSGDRSACQVRRLGSHGDRTDRPTEQGRPGDNRGRRRRANQASHPVDHAGPTPTALRHAHT